MERRTFIRSGFGLTVAALLGADQAIGADLSPIPGFQEVPREEQLAYTLRISV